MFTYSFTNRDAVDKTQPLELLKDLDLKDVSSESELKTSDNASSKSVDNLEAQILATQNMAPNVTYEPIALNSPEQSQVSSTKILEESGGQIWKLLIHT